MCKNINVAPARDTERVLLYFGSRDAGLFGYTLFHYLSLQDLRQNTSHARGEVREENDLRKRRHAVNEATT